MQNFYVSVMNNIPPLSSLYLYLTGSCNLGCQHCWISPDSPKNQDRKPLKFEYIESTIKQALPLGLKTVKLTGGEPLYHPNFLDIIELLSRYDLKIVIETNGVLLTDHIIDALISCGKISFISVSLDGATSDVHDALRGRNGAFIETISALDRLKEKQMHPQVICTLHQKNIHQLDAFLELVWQHDWSSVKFNTVQSIGRGQRFSTDFGLTVRETIDAYLFIEEQIIPHSRIPLFFDIPIAFHTIRRHLFDKKGQCNLFSILGMLHNGSWSLCGIGANIPELVFGHPDNDSLDNVWCTHPKLVELRSNVPVHLEGVCASCIFTSVCNAHCVANNYHLKQKFNAPYYFCQQAADHGLFPTSATKLIKTERRRIWPKESMKLPLPPM